MRGGASGHRSPKDGGGGGRGVGGRIRDGGGATIGAMETVRRKKAEMKMTAARDIRRRHDPTAQVSSDREGEEYCAEVTDRQESADESAEWSGAETKKLATEEEAETAGGAGWVRVTRMKMARGSQGSGIGPLPGGTAANRGDTWVVTSAAADEVGVGGPHGARPGVREKVSGQR